MEHKIRVLVAKPGLDGHDVVPKCWQGRSWKREWR